MKFRASFCDPFKSDTIDLGDIETSKIIETFDNIPWKELLAKMKMAHGEGIYHSPSLEIENKDNLNGLCISAISNTEWYIFFKRPRVVPIFFGMSQRVEEDYMTEKHGQTEKDVKECLTALITDNLQFLEYKMP